MCLFALMVLLGFYEASSTSARNRPHEPTASKPVVPRGYVDRIVVVMDSFDVVVLGGGPAGEVAAGRLADAGLEVALVEDDVVGGECSFYACMPSKALLRPEEILREVHRVPGAAEAVTGKLDVQAVLDRRDEVIHDLDDSSQLPWLEDKGIKLYRGFGVLAGEKRVDVGDDQLEARQAGSPTRASRSHWWRTTWSAASARSTPACRRRRCCVPRRSCARCTASPAPPRR